MLRKKHWPSLKADVLLNDGSDIEGQTSWLNDLGEEMWKRSLFYILEPMIPRRKSRTVVEVLLPFQET